MKRPSAWVLTLISIVILAVVPVVLAVALASGCTGTQHVNRTWDIDAQAAVVLTAHLVDGADAYMASRFTTDSQRPGANLSALELQYAGVNTALHLARPVLLSAQSEIAAVARLLANRNSTEAARVTATCTAMVAIRESRTAVEHIGEVFVVAGFVDAPVLTNGVNALVSVVTTGPLCVAGVQ